MVKLLRKWKKSGIRLNNTPCIRNENTSVLSLTQTYAGYERNACFKGIESEIPKLQAR
jgi:hypothetical protein